MLTKKRKVRRGQRCLPLRVEPNKVCLKPICPGSRRPRLPCPQASYLVPCWLAPPTSPGGWTRDLPGSSCFETFDLVQPSSLASNGRVEIGARQVECVQVSGATSLEIDDEDRNDAHSWREGSLSYHNVVMGPRKPGRNI